MSIERRNTLKALAIATSLATPALTRAMPATFFSGMAIRAEAQMHDPQEERFNAWITRFEEDERTKPFSEKFTPQQRREIGRASGQTLAELRKYGHRNADPFLIVQDKIFRDAVIKQLRKNNFPTDKVTSKEEQEDLLVSVKEFLEQLAAFPQGDPI